MKHISNYIQEGLRINKNTKFDNHNVLQIILNVINPLSDKVTEYLNKWINQENIEEVEIYVNAIDYNRILKNNNNDDSLIKRYKDINANHPVINREVYNNTKNNWHFIGHYEGIGYWKNYFGYSSSERIGRLHKFTSTIYIVGVKNN